MIVDCSYREAVYNVTKQYFFPFVGIFIVLVVIRLLLIFIVSRRHERVN